VDPDETNLDPLEGEPIITEPILGPRQAALVDAITHRLSGHCEVEAMSQWDYLAWREVAGLLMLGGLPS
jgi:hypothetical protein